MRNHVKLGAFSKDTVLSIWWTLAMGFEDLRGIVYLNCQKVKSTKWLKHKLRATLEGQSQYLSALGFWNIKFDELDFLSISNSNLVGYTGSKNLVQSRHKFQFIKLDISKSYKFLEQTDSRSFFSFEVRCKATKKRKFSTATINDRQLSRQKLHQKISVIITNTNSPLQTLLFSRQNMN